MVKMLVIILAAIRICFYMRCIRACIGKSRISKKFAITAFTVLWIFEGFMISMSYLGRGIMGMEFFFLMVEIPFFKT